MKRKFVTNLAFLLFVNLLVKPFYVLGIDVGIQNAVPGSYGIYFPLLSLSLMFQVILDMGIENFTRREIARHHNLLSKYLSNIFVLKLSLALIYFALCMLIALAGDYSMYQVKLLIVLLFNQFLASLILYLRANIGGLHLFKTESIISVLDKTLLIIICGSLLWGNFTDKPFQIEWFIFAQTFAYFATFLVSLIIVLRHSGKFKPGFDLKNNLLIIRKSLPYALLMLLMASYLRIDSVLLERLLPDGIVQAGIYAHSFRLLEMMQNYGYLFAIILMPMFAKMLKNKEPVEQLVHISSLIIFVPAIIISVASVFYSHEIIGLLYTNHLELSAKVFEIIMPGFLGMCSTYIFGALLTANGNLRTLIFIAAAGVIASLVLNLILIPQIGAKGSAIANLSAQMVTAFLQVYAAARVFGFKTNYRLIFRLLMFTAITILLAWLTKKTGLLWFYQFAVFCIASAIVAFALKIFNLRNVTRVITIGEKIN
ncbi:MAG: polysaccharide biosynthesis C-terminal domain-containing protein [Bacteroidales bacterium]|nr:polysaccharide biosynthesis C-terminal domain-containing protein [Bacteroidales bacterium]